MALALEKDQMGGQSSRVTRACFKRGRSSNCSVNLRGPSKYLVPIIKHLGILQMHLTDERSSQNALELLCHALAIHVIRCDMSSVLKSTLNSPWCLIVRVVVDLFYVVRYTNYWVCCFSRPLSCFQAAYITNLSSKCIVNLMAWPHLLRPRTFFKRLPIDQFHPASNEIYRWESSSKWVLDFWSHSLLWWHNGGLLP